MARRLISRLASFRKRMKQLGGRGIWLRSLQREGFFLGIWKGRGEGEEKGEGEEEGDKEGDTLEE